MRKRLFSGSLKVENDVRFCQTHRVFDSGVGGLTVVRALMERLPHENIVYFGDTARVPYGVKSRNTIEEFTAQIVDFLLQNEVKALVIACNTIAAVAGKRVQQMAGNMPVLSVIEAGAQAALRTTKQPHWRDCHQHHGKQQCLCPRHSCPQCRHAHFVASHPCSYPWWKKVGWTMKSRA